MSGAAEYTVEIMSITCPLCKASPKVRCRSSDMTRTLTKAHAARRKAAENATRTSK